MIYVPHSYLLNSDEGLTDRAQVKAVTDISTGILYVVVWKLKKYCFPGGACHQNRFNIIRCEKSHLIANLSSYWGEPRPEPYRDAAPAQTWTWEHLYFPIKRCLYDNCNTLWKMSDSNPGWLCHSVAEPESKPEGAASFSILEPEPEPHQNDSATLMLATVYKHWISFELFSTVGTKYVITVQYSKERKCC
jgi:hypothetical protein